MKRRVARLLGAAAMGISVMATAAYAGTSYQSFSTTAASFSGKGYTSYQSKTYAGRPADVRTSSVGGNHLVDLSLNSRDGKWSKVVYDVGDNRHVAINNTFPKGAKVRLVAHNAWNTYVAVQVSGKWRSN
ncbi:Uncharacterised protein [Mycobacteroides abscessus subsp. abscessus]|nr:Uncharacterised protein [Mycobacteroides abscessus subsp. abscessus]